MRLAGGIVARWHDSYVVVVDPCLTRDMATVWRPGARRHRPVPVEELTPTRLTPARAAELNRAAAAG